MTKRERSSRRGRGRRRTGFATAAGDIAAIHSARPLPRQAVREHESRIFPLRVRRIKVDSVISFCRRKLAEGSATRFHQGQHAGSDVHAVYVVGYFGLQLGQLERVNTRIQAPELGQVARGSFAEGQLSGLNLGAHHGGAVDLAPHRMEGSVGGRAHRAASRGKRVRRQETIAAAHCARRAIGVPPWWVQRQGHGGRGGLRGCSSNGFNRLEEVLEDWELGSHVDEGELVQRRKGL